MAASSQGCTAKPVSHIQFRIKLEKWNCDEEQKQFFFQDIEAPKATCTHTIKATSEDKLLQRGNLSVLQLP